MPMETINIAQNVKPALNDLRRKLNLGTYSQTIDYLLNKFDTELLHNYTPEEDSIKQQLINLMNQHPTKTWLIQEFAGKATKWLELEYNESKKYIERLLPSIHEITKVGDAQYRLSEY